MGPGRLDGDPYGLWKPPPDPRRPKFPYRHGLDLSIRRHIPPPPYGFGYVKGTERQQSPSPPIREVTQSEWCVRHPPADSPYPHPDPTLHSLRVLDEIACKDGRGSQIVRCCLDDYESQVYVAKIYDALYYSFTYSGTPVDVTWRADMDYRCEAASYEDLQKAEVDGLLVPKYYGSWTFDVPLFGSDIVRPVRMVLMEWIQGITMYSLVEEGQTTRIPPQQRLNILAGAMEVYCKLIFHGVNHRDFAPRNIVLVGSNIEAHLPRVLLIDLNRSVATNRPNSTFPRIITERPDNPITYLFGTCNNEFLSWVPQPHRSKPSVFKGWLKTTWENSEEFEAPVGRNLRRLQTDEIEICPPLPDAEPEGPSEHWRRLRLEHEARVLSSGKQQPYWGTISSGKAGGDGNSGPNEEEKPVY
ncbi:hypothetical protein EDB80DRAFT_659097 [Ilyonectria destructans]|nr:hypothetical protein EDB80DRAFT_659097 [Ilyonectria destructans]